MAVYRKDELLNLIEQAIQESEWNVLYLSDQHPFRIKIYNREESYFLKIFIWNLTHGGGHKRAVNEYRIQVKVDEFAPEIGYKSLILGYWVDMEIFAGFDFSKHIGIPGYSSSMQIKEENLRKAHIYGFSACDKGNQEIAIAFRPDFFVEYVRNLEQFHNYGTAQQDFRILEEITEQKIELNNEVLQKIAEPRQKTLITINKKLRDNSFKSRVLTAYNHRCAVCNIQLKLVDAAHILPVSYETSTDETRNGIALCALHHRAYDASLITFGEKYQILHNTAKMKKLENIGHDGEMKRFMKDLRPFINIPPAIQDRPHIEYIQKANEIRGWKL